MRAFAYGYWIFALPLETDIDDNAHRFSVIDRSSLPYGAPQPRGQGEGWDRDVQLILEVRNA